MNRGGKAPAPDLFTLDPAVQSLLNVETFQSKFDIKDFIAGISEKLIHQSEKDTGRQ
jgi:exocyst complex component 5